MPPPTPNAIDLTTVANVIAWLAMGQGGSAVSAAEQQVIQDCITAASAYWLWALGLAPQNGSDPTASPLNSQISGIAETYDGSGSSRQFLRIRPVVSVQSLSIDGISIPASSGVNVPGFVVDGSGKSVSIRSGFGGPAPGQRLTVGFSFFRSGRGWFFTEGVQNVQITYTAGYSATPFDVELAARQMVAVNYKRRSWIDQSSQMMAQGAGSVSYRAWELPPEVKSVMEHYRRRALV